MFEALESRTLLSVVTLVDGLLRIEGTNRDDYVSV